MSALSKHLKFSLLTDLAQGRLAENERAESHNHVDSCSRCASELRRLEQVTQLMRTDDSEDAPRDVLSYARNIFARRTESPARSIVQRIVASLTRDSWKTAPVYAVRSGPTLSRQLLYSAEGNDIDLHITPEQNKWIVSGQVLAEDCAGGEVDIEGGGAQATASLDELCEFTLPALESGNYSLRLRLANIEIEIPELELRA
jgi:hypothetical protein